MESILSTILIPFLNRWRGTGDIFYISKFAITGTIIYALYMFVLVSILSNPIYGFFQGLGIMYIILKVVL